MSMLPIDVSAMLDIGLGQMENHVQVSTPSEIMWNSASRFFSFVFFLDDLCDLHCQKFKCKTNIFLTT
jgi:hypothetical protein